MPEQILHSASHHDPRQLIESLEARGDSLGLNCCLERYFEEERGCLSFDLFLLFKLIRFILGIKSLVNRNDALSPKLNMDIPGIKTNSVSQL